MNHEEPEVSYLKRKRDSIVKKSLGLIKGDINSKKQDSHPKDDLEEDGAIGNNPYLSVSQNNEQKALNVLSKMAKILRTPAPSDNEARGGFEDRHETAGDANGNDSDRDA